MISTTFHTSDWGLSSHMYVNEEESVWGQGGQVQQWCLRGLLQEDEPSGAQEQSANFLA